MSDWWNRYQCKEMLRYQNDIISELETRWNTQQAFNIICPYHHTRNSTLINFIVKHKFNTLILVDSKESEEAFTKLIDSFLVNQQEAGGTNYVANIHEPVNPVSVMTYGALCDSSKISSDHKKAARTKWEQEFASVTEVRKGIYEYGDLDAIGEASAWLKEYALRNLSKYNTSIERFIDTEGHSDFLNNWLSSTADRLLANIQQNTPQLVICYNSHKVTGLWSGSVQYLLSIFLKIKVIGISTSESDLLELCDADQKLHSHLFHVDPIKVLPPSLVRDGCFAPYRELSMFTQPDEDEVVMLTENYNNVVESIKKIEDKNIVEDTLEEFAIEELAGMENDAPGAWSKRREYLTAILQYHRFNNLKMSLTWKPFILNLPSPDFLSTLPMLREYLFTVLFQEEEEFFIELGKEIIKSVEKLGFIIEENEITKTSCILPSLLKRSRSKTQAVISILEKEIESIGDNLQALIVCDFTEKSKFDTEFISAGLAPDEASVWKTFRLLNDSPVTQQINPTIVTPNGIYMNIKFKKLVINILKKWESHYQGTLTLQAEDLNEIAHIQMGGPAWTQGLWNQILQDLLNKKASLCFLGSRFLLTEAWDGLYFNTLIDASSVKSQLACDKIRSRVLPYVANENVPAAHSWDVVTVNSDIEYGMMDFFRFAAKKHNSWCLAEDGEFEYGMSHINSKLHENMDDITEELMAEINEEMTNLIPKRDVTYQFWIDASKSERTID